MDLQKASDTLNHQVLPAKLNKYGIFRVSSDLLKRFLSLSNGYDSDLAAINCGVPQGLVLGPLLFLLYICNLNLAIKVHHFADDTNLLWLSNSTKKLNKLVNTDLKHLVNWFNEHKISINVKKLKCSSLNLNKRDLKVILKKFCGKKLHPNKMFKDLRVKTDANFS